MHACENGPLASIDAVLSLQVQQRKWTGRCSARSRATGQQGGSWQGVMPSTWVSAGPAATYAVSLISISTGASRSQRFGQRHTLINYNRCRNIKTDLSTIKRTRPGVPEKRKLITHKSCISRRLHAMQGSGQSVRACATFGGGREPSGALGGPKPRWHHESAGRPHAAVWRGR